jgi:nucleoside-diphosphate-sugar epimerase
VNTVAVSGATGFIGRRLVRRLLTEGFKVRVLTRDMVLASRLFPAAQTFSGDLGRDDAIPVGFIDGADILYHCAGEVRDITRMKAVNVDGTKRLIAAATGRIGRWVQLSSVGAYGPRCSGVVTEQTELNPIGEYEISKVESDALVRSASLARAFDSAILRPSNVYGPEMRNQSLFGLISMLHRGWYFHIGPPGASANYIHVDNVVAALMLCGTSPVAMGKVFNLSDYCTIEQFVATISSAMQRPNSYKRLPERPIRLAARILGGIQSFPLTLTRIDALTGRVIYSSKTIENDLGYRHIISMEAGLRQMVEFWQLRRG